MELKQQILAATIGAFHAAGMKFTMDDLAKRLGMSKKTIYTLFRDKQALLLAMVDYLFDGIKKAEAAIVADESLSTREKLCRILSVMPEHYRDSEA